MRCPECGASGYNRKTKTPEWRCSKCGGEWDVGETDPTVKDYLSSIGFDESAIQDIVLSFDLDQFLDTYKESDILETIGKDSWSDLEEDDLGGSMGLEVAIREDGFLIVASILISEVFYTGLDLGDVLQVKHFSDNRYGLICIIDRGRAEPTKDNFSSEHISDERMANTGSATNPLPNPPLTSPPTPSQPRRCDKCGHPRWTSTMHLRNCVGCGKPFGTLLSPEPSAMSRFMGFIFSSASKEWDDLSILEKMISGPIVALMGAALIGLLFAWMIFGGFWLVIAGGVILAPFYGLIEMFREFLRPSDRD
jgi:hypothetical protein